MSISALEDTILRYQLHPEQFAAVQDTIKALFRLNDALYPETAGDSDRLSAVGRAAAFTLQFMSSYVAALYEPVLVRADAVHNFNEAMIVIAEVSQALAVTADPAEHLHLAGQAFAKATQLLLAASALFTIASDAPNTAPGVQ
jgi:hypothetical protein